MFCIINYKQYQWYNKPFSKIETRLVSFNNCEYLSIILPKNKKINNNRLYNFLGDLSERVLIEENTSLPHSLMKEVDIKPFKILMLTLGLKDIMPRSTIKDIVLIDINARYFDIARLLSRYCRLKVFTSKPHIYKEFITQVLLTTGAAITITDNLSNNRFFVSPDNVLNGANGTIITTEKVLCDTNICEFNIPIPSDIINIIPSNISPFKFIACLYIFCGYHSVGSITPHFATINNNITLLQNIYLT